jgi:hypothetical protein
MSWQNYEEKIVDWCGVILDRAGPSPSSTPVRWVFTFFKLFSMPLMMGHVASTCLKSRNYKIIKLTVEPKKCPEK